MVIPLKHRNNMNDQIRPEPLTTPPGPPDSRGYKRTAQFRTAKASNGFIRWEIYVSADIKSQVSALATNAKQDIGAVAEILLRFGIESYLSAKAFNSPDSAPIESVTETSDPSQVKDMFSSIAQKIYSHSMADKMDREKHCIKPD